MFAGDKLGNLGVFDASQAIEVVKVEGEEEAADPPEPAITAFKLHTRTISSFLFPASSGNLLFSASYDSSIRSLDLAASKSTELYAPSSSFSNARDEEEDDPVTGIDVPFNSPSTLYFSTMNGSLGRHDTRAPADNSGGTELYQLSEKKIGGFSLHPLQPHLLATASLDRMMKIWDLRKISGARGAEWRLPALMGEHESRLSVSHAAWNEAGQIATASYDDTVKIYDFPGSADWKVGYDIGDGGMKPATVVPHNNQTGRWVTMLAPPPPFYYKKPYIANYE